MLDPLLPPIGILMHLKMCSIQPQFANSDILQYTLLPHLNACNDISFLKNSPHSAEAALCLDTLNKYFKSDFHQISSNFAQFALYFAGYECLNTAYEYDANKDAIEKGLQLAGISEAAVELIAEKMTNFLQPSIFSYLKKLLPQMQKEYTYIFQQLHIPSNPDLQLLLRL